MSAANRNTVLLEEAEIIAHEHYPAGQRVLRLRAPRVASRAEPGSFVHVRCDEHLEMRRPMSVMRADPAQGWVEVLFKIVGRGTELLGRRQPGERLSMLGPIGRGFQTVAGRTRPLLLGGGVGIPPMVFLAERMRDDPDLEPLVIMGSEVEFPFEACESALAVAGMGPGVTRAMPLLESWSIPSRLASGEDFPGCYRGFVTDAARDWLEALGPAGRESVVIHACGPTPMLAATARLAAHYDLPCQVSLEEFMACAIGGCAGCAVRVRTPAGPAMLKVCVDGPVFDAREVVWQ